MSGVGKLGPQEMSDLRSKADIEQTSSNDRVLRKKPLCGALQAVLVLASRDANGDGHQPRNGNRNCDPKCRAFQHRCEIQLFGHTPAICNYRRPQLWANGAPYCQMFERERPCRPSSILLRCGAFLLGLRADHNGAISERCHPGDRQGTACSDVCSRCRAGPLGDRIAGQQSMVSWWNPNNCSPD